MSLVIKSWKVQSRPNAGQPYVQVIARRSGLISFLLSILGIDATTTLMVSRQGFEYERGSLAGFVRRVTPFAHVSSVLYGQYKPWKATAFVMFLSLLASSALLERREFMGAGLGVLAVGFAVALAYYFLNRQLTVAFAEDSGYEVGLTFKRSVVEGQNIDEKALKRLVMIIEALMRGDVASLSDVSMGGAPSGSRSAGTAPTNLSELVKGGGVQGSVISDPA